MFRKFLIAIVIGAGFGIGFVVVIGIYLKIYTEQMLETRASSSALVTSDVPELKPHAKFLDSPGITSGGFQYRDSSILSAGPGEITGKVLANNKPVEGLQFRLALNGSVYSQYTVTDESGQYTVNVPFGTYRIDGYRLNMDVANEVLAGFINKPYMEHVSDEFDVDNNQAGRGITLEFVDAIKKNISQKAFKASEPIILEWEPHPGASAYSIQLYEKEDAYKRRGNRGIYSNQSTPIVREPILNIKDYGKHLKPRYFYTVKITALGSKGKILSYSPDKYYGYDFEIIE